MSDNSMGTLRLIGAGMILLIALLFIGMIGYQSIKYPIGASVSTTAEYNSTFNESFNGHIIAKGWEGITVLNERGEKRTLHEKWLKGGG